jgi:PAT family beta-lactamase induction signal transducer AmpG
MEVLLSITFLVTAGAMLSSNFFAITVVLMFVMATLSATHDIACDGLYLMALDRKRQASFSGVMAMFSRFGRLFVDGVLLVLAGKWIHEGVASPQKAWMLALGIAAILYCAGTLWNFFNLPEPAADVRASGVAEGERQKNLLRTLTILASGVVVYYLIASVLALIGHLIVSNLPPGSVPAAWKLNHAGAVNTGIWIAGCAVALPVLLFLIRSQVRGTSMGDAFVSYFCQPGFQWILAFIIFYRFGEAMIFAMAALFILDKPAAGGMGVSLEHLGFIKMVGQSGGLILGGLLGGWWIAKVGLRKAFLPLVVCMHVPNLLYIWAAYHAGWIGSQDVVIRSLWISISLAVAMLMIVLITAYKSRSAPVTGIVLLLMLGTFYYIRPTGATTAVFAWPLYPVVFMEAFGYGVGFAGYFVYLMHVAQRGEAKFVTSHYAIGTGLGALFITFATILAGIVQTVFGYKGVFIAACLFTIPGTLTLLIIPMDSEQTKSIKAAGDH